MPCGDTLGLELEGRQEGEKGFCLLVCLFKDFVSGGDLPAEKMDREPLKTSDHGNTQFIKEETCWCYGVFLAKVSAVCEVTTVRQCEKGGQEARQEEGLGIENRNEPGFEP